MENIYSPLTNKNNVKKIDILDIARLKKQYLSQYRVDVSRFFNNIKELAIYECQDSKLQFYYPFSPIGDGLFYSELGKGYSGYYSPWRWEHERAYRLINPNDHVLDIGCGSGYFLKKVQDKSARATGLDFNPDAVEYGKQKGLKILSETIKEHSERYGNYYDIICAFQLFEHVNDVR
ncbi:MAG TPA: methyltransferase domain-containing protein, partial [Cytophagaceae bacterium]